MSSIKGSSLRIGGLNSGLDTEAIVNAMSASTKLRITTNQRKVLKLEAQQEAYRSIIDKFNGFRDKYMDSLNPSTWLRSRTTFNRHMAKLTQNGVETKLAGINVTTNSQATAGTYKVTVNNHATQAKYTSAALDSLNSSFNVSQYVDDTITNPDDHKEFAMSVTVGGTQRWISFKGGSTEAEVIENLNKSLQVFGKTNDTDSTGRGRVFYNTDTALGAVGFISTDKAAISTGVTAELKDTINFGNISDWLTGNNSITFIIDGQVRTVNNFQTVSMDYFNDLGFRQNANGSWDIIGGDAAKRAAFNDIIMEIFDKERLDAYNKMKQDDPDYNENFRSVALTQAERVAALQAAGFGGFSGLTSAQIDERISALTSNDNTNTAERNAARNALTGAINAKDLSIRVKGLEDAGFDLSGIDKTNATAVNNFISSVAARAKGLEDAGFDLSGIDKTNATAVNNFISSLETRIKGLEDAGFTLTAEDKASVTALNAFINRTVGAFDAANAAANAANAARSAADAATLDHIMNNQMSDLQKDLFLEEVARRNAETAQTEFQKAVDAAYDIFEAWQRQQPGTQSSQLPNGGGGNPNYILKHEWLQIMGLAGKTAADYAGYDWQDVITTASATMLDKMQDVIDLKVAAFNANPANSANQMTAIDVSGYDITKVVTDMDRRINTGAATAQRGEVDRLMFLQGAYSEQTAYFNSYASDSPASVIDGRTFNQFFQEDIAGITGTVSLTNDEKILALRAAGFTIADGTDADAFIAGLSSTASDASRFAAALLAERTAAFNAAGGLTSVQMITALQGAGINTSGIPGGAYDKSNINDFIDNILTGEEQTKARAAITAAENARIAAFSLTPAQVAAALSASGIANSSSVQLTAEERIAALEKAEIDVSSITDPTNNDEIDAFIAGLTGDDAAKASTALLAAFGAKVDNFVKNNVSATTDATKASNAITGALRDKVLDVGDPKVTREDAARYFNDSSIKNILNNITFADGTKVNAVLNEDGSVVLTAAKDGKPVNMGAIAGANSVNGSIFGIGTQETNVSAVAPSTRLSELGLTPNAQGNYTFSINGVDFSFAGNTQIKDMMSAVNGNARANVEMTFSTLTNTFEIKSKEFGADAGLEFKDGAQGLLTALGFGAAEFTQGKNMSLTIDGQHVEVASNTYEFNGVEITVGPNAVTGAAGAFEIVIERDTAQMFDMIKSFVDDYNALIDYVFGYVTEPPDREYFFLTDTDREELGLSDRQEQKWDERARKGLLYNDRTITGLMANMRTVMFSGVDFMDSDGIEKKFGLFSMGITTSDNWRQNGKLVINEQKLRAAIENDIDKITELFTSTTTDPKTGKASGIMPQLQDVIRSATSTTGERWERGVLVQKAGIASQSSATSNAIYDQIKRLNSVIANLEARYQKQQDRYWKIFSALETQMGQLNGQTDFISQMGMSNLWGGNR
ncbi:MAG: flagellar filament capping protein FliD [Oscillospiraceae bacterium]|nr:flagellar filament capping protein FliD [Oscillospiraceae bacterium]